MFYEEINAQDWEDAKRILLDLSTNYIFRGQINSKFPLQSSIERWVVTQAINDPEFMEVILIEEFKRGAVHYLSSNIYLPKNNLEWFALMQHYGAPTRLLDFTRSPYVACFFAFEEALEKDGFCAVWAVDEFWCQEKAVDVINKTCGKDAGFEPIENFHAFPNEKDFDKFFLNYPKPLRFICPLKPGSQNQRLRIQQGIFLCPGNAYESFSENAYAMEDYNKHIKKIIIPNSHRDSTLSELNLMNINQETLFPGLEGFARSLRNRIFIKNKK